MTCNVLQCVANSDVQREDKLIGVLPLYHIYGMTVLMCYAFAQTAELVLLPKFDPPAFLGAMQKYQISVRCPRTLAVRCELGLIRSSWPTY